MNFLQFLNEAGVTFGNTAYPKEGQVVILAGGAGSGKGFVLGNVLLINGKVFDVDQIKSEVMNVSKVSLGDQNKVFGGKGRGFDVFNNSSERSGREMMKALKSTNINRLFKDYLKNHYKEGEDPGADRRVREILSSGKIPDIKDLELSEPENTGILHAFVDYLGLDKKKKNTFFGNLRDNPKLPRPNVIFDITLKNVKNLTKIYNLVIPAGYDPKNIHLVWILNDVKVARIQNIKRGQKEGGRSVSDDILNKTHIGASKTMDKIINFFDKTVMPEVNIPVSELIQGDVWIVPAKENVDSKVETSTNRGAGKVITAVNKYKLKERGKPMKTLADVEKERYVIMSHKDYLRDLDPNNPRATFVGLNKGDVLKKINDYVPDEAKW